MHILFPVTYTCNLSCKNCCAKKNAPVDIEKGIDKIATYRGKAEWVYITGGEPYLVRDLPDICIRIREMGFKVGVTTNGTIFRTDVSAFADRVGVSIDGDKEYHDNYRGAGTFDSAIETLKFAWDDCETVVMSVLYNDNQDALIRLKPIIEKVQPTYWQIQRDIFNPNIVVDPRLEALISYR